MSLSVCVSWMLQIVQVCMFLPCTFLLLISFCAGKQLLTHNITLSWYKAKFLTSTLFRQSVKNIIPRSEIPMWFNNQLVSMDNSIIIDASPLIHDNNWVGVLCCAIFSTCILGKLNFPRTTRFYNKQFLWF